MADVLGEPVKLEDSVALGVIVCDNVDDWLGLCVTLGLTVSVEDAVGGAVIGG